jgi:hypothetical protein
MALFGHKRQAPRLAPELDDVQLGRVLKGIAAARGPGPQDLAIAEAERLLRETGDDWDRRCPRVGVLAQAAPALARGWRERRPRDPDALALCRVAADARPADPTPWVGALAALRLLGRPSWNGVTSRVPSARWGLDWNATSTSSSSSRGTATAVQWPSARPSHLRPPAPC